MKFKYIFYIALLPLIMAFYGCGNRYENTYVITAENGVNVRATPSTSGKVLGKKEYYQSIKVESINNGWAKFQFGGRDAYVNAKYIKKYDGLDWKSVPFLILAILVCGGGGVAGIKVLKKDGTPDMRYKANRR